MESENRLKTILKTSIVAIIVNVGLGIFKAIIGLITKSIAITMDGINNFTDAGSSLVTILSSYFAAKDPDKKHPFGYGRIEYLGTLLIAVIILYAGVTSFVESVKGIINPEPAEYTGVTLGIIAVAVVVKALLTLYTIKMGKKSNSDSLIASGKEALGDVVISIATIVAAVIFILSGFSIEAWLGAIIALVIVKAGAEILFETIAKILGTGGDVELVRNIKKSISEYECVHGAYDLVLHNYGPDAYMGSVHVAVDDTFPISAFDDLTRKIEADIMEKFGVLITSVGVYSVNTMDEEIMAVREEVKKIALDTEFINQFHGFYMNKEDKTMRFDLVVSFGTKDRRKAYNEALSKVKAKYPEYDIVAGMDSDFNEI